VDGTGSRRKRHALIDPASGSGVRDWNRAVEIIREMELPTRVEPTQKPKTAMTAAKETLLQLRAKCDRETRRKYENLFERLEQFAVGTLHKPNVDDLTYPDMVAQTVKNILEAAAYALVPGWRIDCATAAASEALQTLINGKRLFVV
jgi:hypothetical protein